MGKETRSDNAHLQGLTSGRWTHVGSSETKTVRNSEGRLLRVVLNTNGGAVIIRNGSEVIGNIDAAAPEGTYWYGIYCNDSIIVEVGSGADVTVVHDK